VPWSIENINDFETLRHKILINKDRPKIENIEELLEFPIYKFLINKVIKPCWKQKPSDRPTFLELSILFKKFNDF
jgi:hypothetical protein